MKYIVATLVFLSFTYANAQVLEKPQLVEKIDTSKQLKVEVIEIEAPMQVVEDVEAPRPSAHQTPQFPGGQDSLDRYVKDAVESFIFADTNETFPWGESVYVAFEVATDGSINNPIVEMGYNELLDSAALNIVRNMPRWEPATDDNGLPIVASYRLQILFDLHFEMDDFEYNEEDTENANKAHWAGFELGVQLNTTGFLDLNSSFATTPYWENNVAKSLVFNLNTFQHKFSLIGDVFGLTTGYGFSFNTTELTSSYILQHDADTVLAVANPSQAYKRNTLYVSYFTVPLLLDFTANSAYKKAFYINAGVVGGVRMYSHQRLTGSYANGDKFENVTKSAFNLNTWMLDATVRMGYGYFGVFANYSVLGMFKEGTTAGVYPLRFGISFNVPQ
ncbi:MAG: energy transducer TonB [Flavobacteriales bacterium]